MTQGLSRQLARGLHARIQKKRETLTGIVRTLMSTCTIFSTLDITEESILWGLSHVRLKRLPDCACQSGACQDAVYVAVSASAGTTRCAQVLPRALVDGTGKGFRLHIAADMISHHPDACTPVV